ncbi:Beta/gamma crystallin [Macrophomina phaseolina MS6]|uniref:Beta/gamma crystallin n=1 Tax=Macrophomina phaseolina (strain MS6) TaxID=1126212 RepID=K2QIZ9_MACPH|nr:Beta/gamma crystallin [Macrophomina phaseolina MS6]
MLSKIIILITALAASTVLAAPATTTLERRQRGYITLCPESLMRGDCRDLGIQTGECQELPNGIRDRLSSFDTYGYTCQFFTDGSCSGRQDDFTGNHDNLRQTQWNDEKSSIKCTFNN